LAKYQLAEGLPAHMAEAFHFPLAKEFVFIFALPNYYVRQCKKAESFSIISINEKLIIIISICLIFNVIYAEIQKTTLL
jgi:hypothetical protein